MGFAISVLLVILGTLAAILPIAWGRELSRGRKCILILIGVSIAGLGLYTILLERHEDLRASASGELSPPTLHGRPVTIALGHAGGAKIVWRDKPPFFLDTPDLQLRIRDDRLLVAHAVIRDRSGHPVAEMRDNEWWVNSGNRFQRNYTVDGTALEIINQFGQVVFQFQIVDDLVIMAAKYYDDRGVPHAIGRTPGADTGSLVVGGPGDSIAWFKIEPIFRYPSDRHFGELVEPLSAK